MRTKQNLCFHTLISMMNPGGISIIKREDIKEQEYAEPLSISIEKGSINATKLVGRILGLEGNKDPSPFSDDCFTPNCFESLGLWTRAKYITSLPLLYEGNAFQDHCYSDECYTSFNPVGKIRLPFDTNEEGPIFRDNIGLYKLVDINNDYCIEDIIPVTPNEIDTQGYTLGIHFEGYRILDTYTKDGITIGVESSIGFDEGCYESCIEPTYYLYLLNNNCFDSNAFDECTFSSLMYIGTYDKEGAITYSYEEQSIYDDEEQIDKDFMSGDGTINYLINHEEIAITASNIINLHLSLLQSPLLPSNTYRTYTPLRNNTLSNSAKSYCYNMITSDNTYYRFNAGYVETFIPGLIKDSSVYVVDIYLLHNLTYEPMLIEENIPIKAYGYFYSKKVIPQGLKLIKVKRITRYSTEIVHHHIIGYTPLLLSNTGSLLLYNNKDQYVDLEVISITLINIILSGYVNEGECNEIHKNYYLDPALKELVITNINQLIGLIDNKDRKGSIPYHLTTYLSINTLYNKDYSQRYVKPFEDNVFTDDCFIGWEDNTLSPRSINNRAVAWFLYLLLTYTSTFNDYKYLDIAKLVGNYLINETNIDINLVREGWEHHDTYTGMIPINNYPSSTSMLVVLALLKLHDITLGSRYIDKAADIYLSIENYLWSINERVYFDSYSSASTNINTIIYGLIYASIINKVEAIESLHALIRIRTKPLGAHHYNNSIILSNGALLRSNTGGRYHTLSKAPLLSSLSHNYNNVLPIYHEPIINNRGEALLYYYLLDSVIESTPLINRHREDLNNILSKFPYLSNTIYLSHCISRNILNHPLFLSHSLYDLETLLFHRNFITNKLTSLMPKDYTWFSEKALSSGTLYKLLSSLGRVLSNWYVGYRRLSNGFTITGSEDLYLDQWGREFSLIRKEGETYGSFKERIKSSLFTLGITKDGIEEYLRIRSFHSSIEDTPILGTQSYLDTGINPLLGEAHWLGDKVNKATLTLRSNEPINNDVIHMIDQIKPAGIAFNYIEVTRIDACNTNSISQPLISINEGINSIDISTICCDTYYVSNRNFPIVVTVDQPYNRPIYIYASLKEDNTLLLDYQYDYRTKGLIGVLGANQLSKTIIIPPHHPLPYVEVP